MSPSCTTSSGVASIELPSRLTATTRTAARLDVEQAAAGPRAAQAALDERDLGARVDPLDGRRVGQHPAQHALGGPQRRRHGGDAEALVDRGTTRVVDPGDDPLDAERLARHAGDEDVRVVAVGHRGHRFGALDAGLDQPVAVEADPGDRRAAEVRPEAFERRACGGRRPRPSGPTRAGPGQRRADPATSNDHDVHTFSCRRRRAAWCAESHRPTLERAVLTKS